MTILKPHLFIFLLFPAFLCKAQKAMVMELRVTEMYLHDSDIDNAQKILQMRAERMSFNKPLISYDTIKNCFIAEFPFETDSVYFKYYLLKPGLFEITEIYELPDLVSNLQRLSNFLSSEKNKTVKIPGQRLFTDLLKMPEGEIHSQGAHIGMVTKKDRALLDSILTLPDVRQFFPDDLAFSWQALPETPDMLLCIALKRPYHYTSVKNDMVQETGVADNPYGNSEITITLRKPYHQLWYDMSLRNIRGYLALITDGKILMAPRVMSEIPNGRLSISNTVMTERQARALAACIQYPLMLELKSGSITYRL